MGVVEPMEVVYLRRISGCNEQDATQKFIGKGLAGFIQKPYGSADLLAKIKEVMS